MLGWLAATPVQVQMDSQHYEVRTFGTKVADAFRQLGRTPGPFDQVSPGLTEQLSEMSFIEARSARPIFIQLDDEVSWLESASLLPANLLQSLGVHLLPGDQLWVDGLLYEPDDGPLSHIPSRIRLERAAEAVINVGRSNRTARTNAATIAAVLTDAGLALYEGDQISPAAAKAWDSSFVIEWKASRPITIDLAGKSIRARVAADRVGEALTQTGVVLMGLDSTRPGLSQVIPASEPIRITRVKEEVLVELEPVPFETQYQPLPEVEIDTKSVIDTGAYGVRANQVRVRYENGQEVQRTVEGNWLAREPDPRLIGYGTNIVVRTTSTADGSIEYWRGVEMWATSYSPSRAGVPDDYEWFGITASGKPLKKGLVAIDRSLIPFGTQMYVPGYGFAEAADTGGGVKGLWIDLGYEDDNWVSWSQYVTVYFLTPVPPAGSINYLFP